MNGDYEADWKLFINKGASSLPLLRSGMAVFSVPFAPVSHNLSGTFRPGESISAFSGIIAFTGLCHHPFLTGTHQILLQVLCARLCRSGHELAPTIAVVDDAAISRAGWLVALALQFTFPDVVSAFAAAGFGPFHGCETILVESRVEFNLHDTIQRRLFHVGTTALGRKPVLVHDPHTVGNWFQRRRQLRNAKKSGCDQERNTHGCKMDVVCVY